MAMRKIATTLLLVCLGFAFAQANVLVNPGLEDQSPAFWTPLNGTFGGDVDLTGPMDGYGYHSFKVTKAAAGANAVGFESDNSANLYWNTAATNLTTTSYSLNATIKTEGVNTSPANDDARIGCIFTFSDASGTLATVNLWADQTVASKDWEEVLDITVPGGIPTTITVQAIMGKDATGTVYFDNIGWGTDPWSGGVFNGNAETVDSWMSWFPGGNGSYTTVSDVDTHSGSYSVEMFKPDSATAANEAVYYSGAAPVEPGEWYKIGVWAKTLDVLTNDTLDWSPTFIMKENIHERINLCYFFHKSDPLYDGWDLEGGDKFVYFDQTNDSTDWTFYEVAEQAPENATGISVRARYNPLCMGTTYFDDFTVKKMVNAPTTSIDSQFGSTINPSDFVLSQNYPNPFNPTTIIEFSIPVDGMISVDIYNILGQKIKTLYSGQQNAGRHSLSWNATNSAGESVATGLYIYTLSGANTQVSKKMLLIK